MFGQPLLTLHHEGFHFLCFPYKLYKVILISQIEVFNPYILIPVIGAHAGAGQSDLLICVMREHSAEGCFVRIRPCVSHGGKQPCL